MDQFIFFFLFMFGLTMNSACSSANLSSFPIEEAQEADSFNMDFIMGKFEPSEHIDFEMILPVHADREGLFLHRKTYQSFKKMFEAAKLDSVHLVIRSATRNFESQKGIWERKWTGNTLLEEGINAMKDIPDEKIRALKILEYSSMPGSSRHHWGTDIDLNAFVNSYFETDEGLKIYTWLQNNAWQYGFCQPYTEKNSARPNGYNEEKWHWSYIPLAKNLLAIARTNLDNADISGFMGSDQANIIGIKEKYIFGINQECL